MMRLYRPVALWRIGKDRRVRMRGVQLDVPVGVFHPALFFSTRFLIDEIERLDLHGRTALDLGCGSGLISLVMARRGAIVTAIDINPLAVQTTLCNAERNHLALRALCSDLFSGIPTGIYDVIAINPPYYRRAPVTPADQAWFCGENFEYFRRLFRELHHHTHESSRVLMILSEDCDIAAITAIANANGMAFGLRRRRMIWLEENMIFNVHPSPPMNRARPSA